MKVLHIAKRCSDFNTELHNKPEHLRMIPCLLSVFFAPVGVKVVGERDDLAIDFYEGDDGLFQFVEGLHGFLLSEVLTQ